LTPSPEIKRVEQGHLNGCTAAAVAMVLGKTYDEVQRCSRVDFRKDGCCIEIWFDYLFQEGFVYHRMYRCVQLQGGIPREVWPPPPFAPVHICLVSTALGGHAVVMLENGDVLDPAKEGRFKLSDYAVTYVVYGFWRRP
jgi:hypothetical protein